MADVKTFDAYEYVGVIAPGAILAIALFLQWPDARTLLLNKTFSLGDLGIFLIYAFVLGHIIQAAGNILEWLVFLPVGGKPTNWVRKESQRLITSGQRQRLISRLSSDQQEPSMIAQIDARSWYSTTREVFARVAAAGRTSRIDAFNRNYGLMRGISASLLIAALWLVGAKFGDWRWAGTALGLFVLATYRMYHFGILYARELFVQYLALPQPGSGSEPVANSGIS